MDKIEARLKRIEGQIKGIKRMYKSQYDCEQIAQQIAAARSALASVGREILSGEAVRCMRSGKNYDKFRELVNRLFSFN